MSEYCYTPNQTVVDGPRTLPVSWRDPKTGKLYANFNKLSGPELLALEWYPYVENDPGSPGIYYDKIYGPFVVNPTNVTRDVTWQQWNIEDVRQDKDNKLQAELTSVTADQLALDGKIPENARNETKWLVDEQAKLYRLTDWQAVADFVTAMPTKLVLPNDFAASSYVVQGTAMKAENTAASQATLTPRWDPVELDAFIAANKSAAADVSGTQPPTHPGHKLRQGVVVPSEQSARVIIYREVREDPNPALRTTYKMRLLNRQDARDLYIFSYTNSTYLTWHKFEDISQLQDGSVWGLEAHSAEWQYVPGDMAFIFSYGTNPAVEADYFTDRVEFPAGVDQINVWVAWDTE